MEMTSVSSSHIREVGYDAESSELRVKFKNGAEYSYDGVPKKRYDEMMVYGSIGEYFAYYIKDSYSGVKV